MATASVRRAALAAVLVLAAALAPGGPQGLRPLPAHAAGSPTVPGTACLSFPADNVWNTDISSQPVNSQSGAWLNSTGANAGRRLHPDFGDFAQQYGIPFNVVSPSHATVTPSFDYAGESDIVPYPWGSDLHVEAPTDSHLLSINSSTCELYETFATDIPNNHAGSGATWNLNSNALRPDTWTSADAAGLPIFPLLLRPDEIDAGAVNHAIRFTVQSSDTTYLWPARHQAGSASDPNLPPMGARFRLKAGFDTSSYGPEAQIVLTAFKHYGVIVADNGSNWFFQGSTSDEWDLQRYQDMVTQLKTVPASAFEAIDESSLMVDPNSAQAGHPTPPPPATSSYFTWYDFASAGMVADNIHIVNPDSANATSVTVRGPGPTRNLTLQPGAETFFSWPAGTIGGPVTVTVNNGGPAVIATQRVQYYQTFNEVAAVPGPQAATEAWFPWYDLASPGMLNDNIHVINPDPATASTVRISAPWGYLDRTLQPGGETYVSWPGEIGGPARVAVTQGPAVIASQRVQYNGSFNETSATPTGAASARSLFTWYDHASPGMLADNVHLTNPDPNTDAHVTVSGPGHDLPVTVPHAGATYVAWPQGTIGGPVTVTVTSGPNVIASKRVQYGGTFNEVHAMPVSTAALTKRFTWYDRASPGMVNDDIHVVNPSVTQSAQVTVSGPAASRPLTIAPGADAYMWWVGGFGGPVTVTSTNGVAILASQRVEYYASFNEVGGL